MQHETPGEKRELPGVVPEAREREPLPQALTMVREQLERRGVHDPGVLHWMARIPRHLFLPLEDAGRAYRDSAQPLASGQTVSQPYMVGAMTQALHVLPGQRILEVGTGSGYQTALLALMGAEVYTVERHAELSHAAQDRLRELGLAGIRFRVGDGTVGWEEEAPFHGILVTAGAPRIPQSLLDQLQPDGRLVIPVGDRQLQRLLCVALDDSGFHEEVLMECRFVPLLGTEGWSRP